MNQGYQYVGLDENVDEIRLLTLLRGGDGDPLSCSLAVVRLKDAPVFEAISYTWGDPSITENITCNGDPIRITTNLADALRELRHPHDTRLLWADAICIDQMNLGERSHQVSQMANIFRSAQRVLVWLGKDDEGDGEVAFSLLTVYARKINDEVGRGFKGDLRELPWLEAEDRGLNAIAALFGRPWFTRVWVLQEVGVAAEVMMLCGPSQMPFQYAITFCCVAVFAARYTHDITARIAPVTDAYFDIWTTFESQRSWITRMPITPRRDGGSSKMRLFGVVFTTFFGFQASDCRDGIYAMLGHPVFESAQNSDVLVRPDYTISIQELIRKITVAEMLKKKQLSLFSMVQHTEGSILDARPSWVPWRLKTARQPIDWQCFTACADLDASVVVHNDTLQCQGFPIDVIAHALEEIPNRAIVSKFESIRRCLLLKKSMTRIRGVSRDDDQILRVLSCILNCSSLAVPGDYLSAERRDEKLRERVAILDQLLASYTRCHRDHQAIDRPESDSSTIYSSQEVAFIQTAQNYCSERKVFCTESGYWGLGPDVLRPGDVCCILYGARVPYVLRPSHTKAGHRLLGECYIYGMMHGEAMDLLASGRRAEEYFALH